MSASMLPRGAVLCLYAAGAAVAIFLLVQHWVHVPVALPWLILLACPLLHLFVHRGHHRHSHDRSKSPPSG
jgi:hypothetical protein